MSCRVDLHLRIRVSREKRPAFEAFLREAIPFYEQPGGIRVRLVENEQDSSDLIEIVEYATIEKYQTDQLRVADDKEMHDRLARWRELLDGRPEVIAYFEKPVRPAPGPSPAAPSLRTSRLLLRPLRLADAPAISQFAGDRRIAAMTLTLPHPYELHHAESWIAAQDNFQRDGTQWNFAICEHSGPLVGVIGLVVDKAHERAEIGYWIGIPFWRRGYATEASIALIDHGFSALHLNRIYSQRFDANPASGRVIEKSGLKPEGLLRGHVLRMGTRHDVHIYGLTRDDWAARRTAETTR